MFKQLLISLVVLIVAAAGYVYFVPGADVTVRKLGINVPFPTAYVATADVVSPGTAAPTGSQRSGQSGAPGAPSGQNGTGRPGGPGGPGGRPQVATVITAPVTVSTINDKLTAIGQGTAAQSVSVTSQATGTLVKLAVSPGDKVKAGQIIGQLDSDAEQIAFDKATLAAKDAADTLQRTQTLAKTNAATAVALAVAQLASDNANLELRNAKLALDKRSIVTPIDGTVGLFQVTAGNAVGAQTIITTIDDNSSILINYWVPERYAPVLKPGMPVSTVAIALPDQSFDGAVTAVDSRIDPVSRTLQVQAKIPNPAGAVTPGMSFEISMAFPGDKYPAVDPLAIQWGATGSYVWLLSADSKVKKDPIQIIQRNSDGVLVKGDLTPGQQVVTQGVLQLADGATVRRLDSGAPSAGTGDKPPSTAAADGATATGAPAGQRRTGKPATDGGTAPSTAAPATPAASSAATPG